MTLVMYDSIDLSQFAGLTMDAAAGYVDGRFPTYSQLASHVPPGTKLLSITVFGNQADCVDQEPGNIGAGPAADWIANQIKHGHKNPVLYTSASNAQNMINLCANRGVARNQYKLWSAHYTGLPHICGKDGFPAADGTQWTDQAHGRNLDESQLKNDFFGSTSNPPEEHSGGLLKMSTIILKNGAGAITPFAFPPGATRIRSYSDAPATVDVHWLGAPMNTMLPAPDNCPDWRIPANVRAARFIRRDGGTNDVTVSAG